jgi:predicted alpha-1,2-mannosidase
VTCLIVLMAARVLLAGSTSFVDQVVMSMGVQAESNGVIGPQLPHGSINPSPQTPHGGHGGYRPREPVRGFGQLHVSGTGWGTYGQIFLSPQTGLAIGESEHDSETADEAATPAYYGVTLKRYGIRAEVTPTHHAALYRFTYPAVGTRTLLFDLAHSIPTDIAPEIRGRFLGGELRIHARENAVSGWGIYSGGFNSGAPYRVFFYAVANTPFESFGTWTDGDLDDGATKVASTRRIGGYLRFAQAGPSSVRLKIAVSFRNGEQAQHYLANEIPGFDFDAVRTRAEARWNETLGSIVLEGASPPQAALFYTALYHSFVMPRDRTGDNPQWTSDAPFWDDHYAVWDTWRSKFPLMCLLRPSMVRDNVLALCDRLEHTGEVGDSFVAGDDGPKQGGDDVDAIVAEAYATDVKGIDWSRAFALLRHTAEHQRYPEYLKRGWIPDDQHPLMACSNTLECAYNDATSAAVAAGLAKNPTQNTAELQALSAHWRERALRWEKLWNPQLTSDGFAGFVQPRQSDETWIVPFEPKQNFGSWHSHFYEANSWTYSLFVPHDFARLIALSGGPERFVARVDHAFSAKLVELANEPSFMAARAFNYAGRPDRNAYWTHKVMTELYSLTRGYPGNEDSGAMGSWYVFSAMGFFPNAGQGVYLINGPFCPKITLTMEDGRKLVVEARGVSPENLYVQSLTLNGKAWTRNWFTYDDIRKGGHLEFVMGPQPSDWGTEPPFAPSLSEDRRPTP